MYVIPLISPSYSVAKLRIYERNQSGALMTPLVQS